MSQTRTTVPRRTRLGRIVTVAAVATLATAGSLLSVTGAFATTSTLVHVTAVSPHLVSALTANQVITVTGTGFDQSVISTVTVTNCTGAQTFIVVNPTTLVVKTDSSCTAGALNVVTVTDTAAGTALSVPGATGGGQALTFVTAPSIAASTTSVYPGKAVSTIGLAYANIATAGGLSVSTKGGTSIQITAGANIFVQSGIAVSLGGVALTNVVVPSGGLTLTGVTGAHPAADPAPVLKITNNGVSKSFAYAAPGASTNTHSFQIDGSTITVAPASGPSKGANNIVITGAGFSTTAGNDAVTVNGAACTAIVGTQTATSITCTVPAMLTPFVGPVTVKVVVTGGTALTSVVSAGSTYTYVAQ